MLRELGMIVINHLRSTDVTHTPLEIQRLGPGS
jgi:hypothetical protein